MRLVTKLLAAGFLQATSLWGYAAAQHVPIYKIERIGPAAESGPQWTAGVLLFSQDGKALGTASRTTTTSTGTVVWIDDGQLTRIISPGTGIYQGSLNGRSLVHAHPLHLWRDGRAVLSANRYDGSEGRGQDVFLWDGSQLVLLGPTGARYEELAPGWTVPLRASSFYSTGSDDPDGVCIGSTARTGAGSITQGNSPLETWFVSGTQWQSCGLTTGNWHSYGVDLRFSVGSKFVAGRSQLVPSTVQSYDAWITNGPQTLSTPGLTSTPYVSPTFSRGPSSRPMVIDAASGHLAGQTEIEWEYGAGSDTWMFDGAAVYRTNLTGAGYEWRPGPGLIGRRASTRFLASGMASGYSFRYDPSVYDVSGGSNVRRGTDAWACVGDSTTRISPPGVVYEWLDRGVPFRTSDVFAQSGRSILGTAARFSPAGGSRGQDAWLHEQGVTLLVGLQGAPYEWNDGGVEHRLGTPVGFAGTGSRGTPYTNYAYVVGQQHRFSAAGEDRGRDVWSDDGLSTRVINPVGGDYEWMPDSVAFRTSTPVGVTNFQGEGMNVSDRRSILGSSDRFLPTGQSAGNDLWCFDGSVTRVINPTGDQFQWMNSGVAVRRATFKAQNALGFLAGTANRYSPTGGSLGIGAWVYDPVTNETTAIVPATNPVTGVSDIRGSLWLTPDGVLFGSYRTYSPSGNANEDRAFIWSRHLGVRDLASLVDMTPAGAEWANLGYVDWVTLAGQTYIVGRGTRAGDASSNQSIFRMTLLPPACLADFNNDNIVNTPDLTFFLGRFGQPATPGSPAARADFNADGAVNTADLTFFLGRFGQACP